MTGHISFNQVKLQDYMLEHREAIVPCTAGLLFQRLQVRLR
jgi:hypothetical protein